MNYSCIIEKGSTEIIVVVRIFCVVDPNVLKVPGLRSAQSAHGLYWVIRDWRQRVKARQLTKEGF